MLAFYSLYVVMQYLIVIVTLVLGVYAWHRRRTPGATPFAALMLLTALYSFSLAMLALSDSPQAADFWGRQVRFTVIALAPVLVLIFAIQYTGREQWLRGPWLVLLFVIPLVTVALTWGGPRHYFFLHVSTDKVGPFTFLGEITTRGPWSIVHVAYSYLVIFLSLALFLIQVFRTRFPYRGQAILLLIGSLCPLAANIPDTFLVTGPRPSFTPFGFLAQGLFYAWALFGYRLFDIAPVARELVIESMDDALLVVDEQQRLVDANPAAQRLVGRTASELIGLPLAQVLPAGADLAAHPNPNSRTEFTLSVGGEERHIALSRQPIHDRSGRLVGHLLLLRDITPYTRAQDALQRAHDELERRVAERTAELATYRDHLEDLVAERTVELRKLSLAVEQSASTVVITDREGRIEYTNPAFKEITGYGIAEALGQNPRILKSGAHDEAYYRELWETITSGGTWRGEFRNKRKDGSLYWERATIAPIINEQGQITHFVAVKDDITERKQAAAALERRVEELAILNLIAHTVATVTDLPLALEGAAQTISYIFAASTTSIALWQSGRIEILAHFEPGRAPADPGNHFFSMATIPAIREPLDRGEALSIPDIQALPLPDDLGAAFRARNLHALLLAPLRIRGTAFGLLAVARNQAGPLFSPAEVRLAETIAADIASAIENARLYEQARELAVLEERQRLARDLHDSVTQTLYSVALMAEALPYVWQKHPDEAQEALNKLHRLARGALGEMRALLLELQPAMLLEKELGDLLCQLGRAAMGRTALSVETQVRGERPLPDAVHIALYRIAQEALNNVVKHAVARRAIVELDLEPEQVVLGIEDDGRGFDPQAVAGQGFGLRSMADRAEAIGARFHLESRPGQGTQINVVWQEPRSELADKR